MRQPGWFDNGCRMMTQAPGHLEFWLILDTVYAAAVLTVLQPFMDLSAEKFIVSHLSGIAVGTLVMFTGLGAGVLWIPILTLLNIKPTEAVSISIFTQIAGKGMGSLTYLICGMVDLSIVRLFIPFAFIGALAGYLSGFLIIRDYEKILIYIFIAVAIYLLIKMIRSVNETPAAFEMPYTEKDIRKSYPIVVISSFFTGLLSIGNTDWLIPHMIRNLKMNTSRAVATGLFIMFVTSLFFLLMTFGSVLAGFRDWPAGSSILFGTCSGVILGGQFGTRMIRYPWFAKHQKHAFILFLILSIIHLLLW